jgi:Delta7-sterol 5-desaturase
MTGVSESTGELIREFLVRGVISGSVALVIYFIAAGIVARVFPREVARDVTRHDIKWGVVSLLVGSPILQGYALAQERWGISLLYTDIGEYGWIWWVLSMPIYVMLWDLVFYLTHRVLHWPKVYRGSHFRHHSCRPPVAWSGIAIDPLETLLSGIAPYVIPLFILPFHIWTVYALNMGLLIWATCLHSSMPFAGNAVILGPKDHNLHHTFGLKNCNYAAVFTFWDRLGGTLDRVKSPPWWGMTMMWRPKGSPQPSTPQDGPDRDS